MTPDRPLMFVFLAAAFSLVLLAAAARLRRACRVPVHGSLRLPVDLPIESRILAAAVLFLGLVGPLRSWALAGPLPAAAQRQSPV